MTARPPRASTRGEGKARPEGKPESKSDGKGEARPAGKRARSRGATHAEQADRDKRRSASVVPTDRYERIGDDDVLEVADLAEETDARAGSQLRMLVLEAAPHLAAAQAAIAAAGHVVVIGAAGRDGVDKLRFAIGEVDAMLIGMPGGEPLLDLALAQGGRRPVVIAAWTASALEAARRSTEIGADLATVRPHDVERLAPILLAAGRLVEQRRLLVEAASPAAAAASAPGAAGAAVPAGDAGAGGGADLAGVGVDVDVEIDVDDMEGEPDPEPAGLLSAESFAQAAHRELERARRHGHPLAVAMFMLDVPPPPPPPGLRGIVRARAGNALVHALREVDLATELDQDRFLVVMPDIDRTAAAELARRLIGAVAAGDPVTAAGRTFPPRVIGAVAGAAAGAELDLPRLVHDATQLLEQAQVTGASLAVES